MLIAGHIRNFLNLCGHRVHTQKRRLLTVAIHSNPYGSLSGRVIYRRHRVGAYVERKLEIAYLFHRPGTLVYPVKLLFIESDAIQLAVRVNKHCLDELICISSDNPGLISVDIYRYKRLAVAPRHCIRLVSRRVVCRYLAQIPIHTHRHFRYNNIVKFLP